MMNRLIKHAMRIKVLGIVCFLTVAVGFSLTANAQFGGLLDTITKKDTKSGKKDKTADLVSGALGFGKTLLSEQTEAEEIAAGDAVTAMYLGSAPLVADNKVQRYVNAIGKRVASKSGRPDLPWSFGVIETESINAFAAPGGKVLITKGLFQMLDTEDELAWVLGHEVAHVDREHHWKLIKRQKLIGQGADLAATQVDTGSALGEAAFDMVKDFLKKMISSGIDRGGEYEADVDGVYLSTAAGYDSTAGLAVLDKLSEAAGGSGDVSFLYQTHPTAEDRTNHIAENFSEDMEQYATPSKYADRIAKYNR